VRGQPTIEQILLPVDFSEFSRRAKGFAFALSRLCDARLLALHVYRPILLYGGDVPSMAPFPMDAATRSQLLDDLVGFVEPARKLGVRVDVAVEEGNPYREILNEASAMPADVIIIGTHGLSALGAWMLGSTAEKVLRNARCPVLTVSGSSGGEVPRDGSIFRRILCPLDLSESSAETLRHARLLAQKTGAALCLLHAVPSTSHGKSPARTMPGGADPREAEAREHLEQFVDREGIGSAKVEQVIASGEPQETILREAEERHADVIVMGIHGGRPVDLSFLGSTAQHVVRKARCPVLTVRPRRALAERHTDASVRRSGTAQAGGGR